VQVPDCNVAITAATEADLRVRTDGQCIARRSCRRQLGLYAWCWLHDTAHQINSSQL